MAISMVAAESADFAALVRLHQSMVFSLANHFVGNSAVAEDIAQDVLVELYRHHRKLQSPEHVVFWLRRVTANRCIDYARSHKRQPEVALDEVPELVAPADEPDPWAGARLRRLVASLPERVRIVVLLRYQEDLGPDEIAKLLGMRVNTVKSQLHRALAMLREKATRAGGGL
ncbi:MAG: RNA polymerase sigma factor [Terriglobales bacterium]